jgi:hypothetical protein
MSLALASANAKFKPASRHFAPYYALCVVTVAQQQLTPGLDAGRQRQKA